MKRKGITIHTGAKLTGVKKSDEQVTAVLESGEELTAEKMLVSIGRRYNTDGIGLETTGVRTEGGKVVVDAQMQTSIPGIYAVGDVASRYLLAHVASAEGKVAAQNCLGASVEMNYQVIPWCVFTLPEIGHAV